MFSVMLTVLSIDMHDVIPRKQNFMLFRSIINLFFFALCSKTCLNLIISRIKLLRNRRELQLINMRKEMVQYLQTGQESIARIRVSWSNSCFLGIVCTILFLENY
jgi:hypothetical protein